MFDNMTFEFILNRMLSRIPDTIDKRQGSIIWDALAPAAAEMAQMYIDLGITTNLTMVDTATDEYLTRKADEYGVERKEATKAIRRGLFYNLSSELIDVPLSSRYSDGTNTYIVLSRNSLGNFNLECETYGSVGNDYVGQILPIDYVPNLVTANLTDIIVPASDTEDDDSLRERTKKIMSAPAFGGNISDYEDMTLSLNGVGAVKVVPVWQGGGTVKLIILDSNKNAPNTSLIDIVQTAIDPVTNSGVGIGLAPIGHRVTVVGATQVVINVEVTLTLESGYTIAMVQTAVENSVSEYLASLREVWKESGTLTIRISGIESRLLDIVGIVDVADTSINGNQSNLVVPSDSIPTFGGVIIDE